MKDESVFLSVDIGTSAMKAALFSCTGELRGFAGERLVYGGTSGGGPGVRAAGPGERESFDAEEWVRAFGRLASALGSPRPCGITVSGHGPSLVPVGEDDRPCHDVLLWFDSRAKKLSGVRSFFLPKAAWLRDEAPRVYEKTRVFIPCSEYLGFRLTGERFASSPSRDFSEFLWTDSSWEGAGLDHEKFPPLVFTGSEAGKTGSWAGELGIPPGIPVYAGGPDFLMTQLGTACVRPARVCDRAGSSEGINACSVSLVSSRKLRSLPHVIGGLWNAAAILPSTGLALEWMRELAGKPLSWDEFFDAALGAEKTFTPSPEFFPPFEGGAVSFSEWFLGLRKEGRVWEECALTLLYAVCSQVQAGCAALEDAGLPVRELRVSGGQARSAAWNRFKAARTGKVFRVPEVADAELVGGLAAGLYGGGLYGSLSEAAEDLARFGAEFGPG
ncbi:MAG: FGGY-family carbohydrate kinase [Spirochaetales bacterium]|jgi:xylulokinase|nr:FGGY-family carbohydrate kinase [Spirochaetales bacterium]